MKKLLTLLFAALAASLSAHCQTRIDGVVTDDRFFYIGIFVSLKNSKAYDIANF